MGALASIVGGVMSSNAISSAANSANQTEQQMYQQTRSDLLPYNTAGQTATTQMTNLLGLNGQDAANSAMSTYQTSPGYQWSYSQGLRAVDAGASAAGLGRSGAATKAEETFGQGLANQDYSQYYNRLSGLASTGETAAANTGTAGSNAANQIASTDTSAASALSSIYGNVAKSIGNQTNSLLNAGLTSMYS